MSLAQNRPSDRAAEGDQERRLVARLRRRDEAAFAELVSLHRERLTAVAMRILRNEDDARDAVQVAFASAFTAIDGFDAKSRLGTWLYRIAANAALMMLRTRRRHPEEDLSATLMESERSLRPIGLRWASTAPSPEALAIQREEAARLRVAMRSLCPDERRLIELRDIRELSTRHVALQLSLTPNATKVRLHRARRALRHCYDELRIREPTEARRAGGRTRTSTPGPPRF